ncbi:MAG: hypothetical protein ACPGK3_05140 [Paracoccaceae bacterium]
MSHNAVDIWLHAANAADISASLALYERLLQQDDFNIVLSCGDDIVLDHMGVSRAMITLGVFPNNGRRINWFGITHLKN